MKWLFKNIYSKQFLFSTPFSSFRLPSLLLPFCSLTHFVDASATFAPRQDGEELGLPIQTLQPQRYPLMLFESINYYLGWVLGTTSPFFANSTSWSGLR